MRYIQDCEIVAHDLVAPDHWRMRLRSADIARAAQPGQFCMVEVVETLYPFLRRPMCLLDTGSSGQRFSHRARG